MTINYIDIGIIIILILFVWKGFRNGLLAEIASLAGVLVGFYLAQIYATSLNVYLVEYISSSFSYIVSFVVIILATMIVAGLLARLLQLIMKMVFLAWLDTLLGATFGLVKGALLISIVINIVFTMTKSIIIQDSIFLPYYNKIIEILAYLFK